MITKIIDELRPLTEMRQYIDLKSDRVREVNRVGADFGAAVRHGPCQGERGHMAGWRLTEWPAEWPESWRTGWRLAKCTAEWPESGLAECSDERPESWLAECSDEWLARGWLNVRLSGWRAGWRAGRLNSLRSGRMRRLMRVVIWSSCYCGTLIWCISIYWWQRSLGDMSSHVKGVYVRYKNCKDAHII